MDPWADVTDPQCFADPSLRNPGLVYFWMVQVHFHYTCFVLLECDESSATPVTPLLAPGATRLLS